MTSNMLLSLLLMLLVLASCGQGSRDEAGTLATPNGLEIQVGDEALTLTWNANSETGLKGYNIFWSTSESELALANVETVFVAAPATSATITGLTNDTDYFFALDAENEAGERSARSSARSAAPRAHYRVQGNFLNYGSDSPGGAVNVRVTRRSEAVETASITVNGEALVHEGEGLYRKSDVLPSSDTLNLSIAIGEVVLTGTGTIPAEVVVTEPADGATYAPTDTIVLQWTSATDPDSFIVWVTWVDDGSTLSKRFDLEPAARQLAITASELPLDIPVTLSLRSVNESDMVGFYEPVSFMRLQIDSNPLVVLVASSPDTTPPATPTGLAAIAGDEEVELTWDASSETDIKGYNVYWGNVSGDLSETVFVAAPSTGTTVVGLDNGTTYYFAVSAEDWSGNESPRSSEVGMAPSIHYFVIALLGGAGGNVDVLRGRDGSVVSVAVTVNGEAFADIGDGRYKKFPLDTPVSTGGTLELEITGEATASAIGIVPETPVVTEPADGSSFPAGDEVIISWTSTVDSDQFIIWLSWTDGATWGNRNFPVSGDIRSLTVPADELPTGIPISLTLTAYNYSTLSGPVVYPSRMQVSESSFSTFTLTP